MTTRTRRRPVDDLSQGRVPAALELAAQLGAVERARLERRRAEAQVRACARAVLHRYEAARAVGWTDDQLAAAGLVPPDDIVSVAHLPDELEL